jgi:folate-dependent phosphoribosylglycinamide formyltransferase PurN
MHAKTKIAIIGKKSSSSYAVCNYLNSRFSGCAFVFERPETRYAFVRRRAKKLGLLRVAGQVAFQLATVPVLSLASRARLHQIHSEHELSTLPVGGFEIPSVNSADAIALVNRLQPAVIVLAGTRIVGQAFLENVKCPVLNIHAGITPQYRGVHGGYWALVERRTRLCGVTVHQVDAGIDTGEVLKQSLIQPSARDNFATYPWIQLGVGLKLLAEVLPDLLAGRMPCTMPGSDRPIGESRLRTHPTVWEYFWHRTLHGVK